MLVGPKTLRFALALLASTAAFAQKKEAYGLYPPRTDTLGNGSAQFAVVLDFDGDWLVVGAPGIHDAGTDGAAYFYRLGPGGFELGSTLRGPISSGFAYEVAVSGSSAVISGHYYTQATQARGRIYTAELGNAGWVVVQEITPDGLRPYAQFGWSVDLDGDVLAVGAPGNQVGPEFLHRGTAFIYERSGPGLPWVEAYRFDMPAGHEEEFGFLGGAVAVQGQTVVFGADRWEGAAYVFERTDRGWGRTAILRDPSPSAMDEFGLSVALDVDTIAVGQPKDKAQGAVHVFRREGDGSWSHAQELQASDGYGHHDHGDHFGTAVALEGDRLLVGAIHAKGGANEAGKLYRFERDGVGSSFDEKASYRQRSPYGPADNLGQAVALEEGLLVGGTPGAGGTPTLRPGAVHVFHEGEGLRHCKPRENSTGLGARLDLWQEGQTEELTLAISRSPGNSPCILAASQERSEVHVISDGRLCLQSPVFRLAVLTAGAYGEVYLETTWSELTGAGAVPGESWHVQAMFYDDSAKAWNTTNAVTVTAK